MPGKEFSQSDSLKTKRSLRFHSCESCASQGLDWGSVQGMQNRKAWLCLRNFVILVSGKQYDFILIAKLWDKSIPLQTRFLLPNFPFFIFYTSPNLAPPWSMLSTVSVVSFLETLPAYLFFMAPLSFSQMPYEEHAFLSVEPPTFARHLEKTQLLPLHCVHYWTNCIHDISYFLVFFDSTEIHLDVCHPIKVP